MPPPLSNLDRELLRRHILRYLASHHPAAFDPDMLRRAVHDRRYIDFLPSLDETNSALTILADLGLVTSVAPADGLPALGSSLYYRATAQGVIGTERQSETT